MNPELLSRDAYATLRGLRHIPRIKTKFIAAKVRDELQSHRLILVDGEYLSITDAGMAVPRRSDVVWN